MEDSAAKPYTLRLPPELHTQLLELAHSEQRSLQSLIVAILSEAVDKWHTARRQDVIDHWDENDRPPP